jgi:hypothetical protein
MLKITELPKRQQAAIPALLQHKTIRAAAAQVGVREQTLLCWLRDATFQAVYREARYLVMDEAFQVLQKACTEAAETLVALMQDHNAAASVRLQAAQTVLATAIKSRVVDELEVRLTELERLWREAP